MKIFFKFILIFIGLLSLIFTNIPILVSIGIILLISFSFIVTTQAIKKKAYKKINEYNYMSKLDNKLEKEMLSNNYSNELINNSSKQKIKVLKKTKF